MKILLVEDSKFVRVAMERSLASRGYEVLGARDGEEALRLAFENVPDLILLDMMLPKMTGPDLLHALKHDPVTAHIPVVVLSALSQKNEAKLLEAGAAAYFEKSEKTFEKDMGGLFQMIENILKK
jgi:CheY-like chemotaxis protein